MKLLQHTLDEKRAELLKTEEKLHEVEEKYYSNVAMVNDKVKDDLRVIKGSEYMWSFKITGFLNYLCFKLGLRVVFILHITWAICHSVVVSLL